VNLNNRLEVFLNSYLETALWSSTDSDTDEPLDFDCTIEDLAEETVSKAKIDCNDFLTGTMSADLQLFLDNLTSQDTKQAGHDFWLTRNHHGAGFWDGDWPEPQATMLTERSHAYGSVDLYVGDDGYIYSSP
jgi:hypothetical protein